MSSALPPQPPKSGGGVGSSGVGVGRASAGEKRRLSDDSEASAASSSASASGNNSNGNGGTGRPTKLRRPTGLPKLNTSGLSSSSRALPAKSPRHPPGFEMAPAPKAAGPPPLPTPKVAGPPPLPSPASSSAAGDQNVRVVVRIRPLSSKEKREQSKETLKATPGSDTIFVDKNRKHEFDAVIGPGTTQENVYNRTAGDTVRANIFKGFNVTILAYGQTGSGKTYSMGTNGDEGTSSAGAADENMPPPPPSSSLDETEKPLVPPNEGDGIIPRAVYDLFHRRSTMQSGPSRVKVDMSYLEIYNEEANDLLADDGTPLVIRDSKTEGVIVQGLSTHPVTSPQEVRDLMESASERRVVASTAMNAVSSRSHAICTLHVTIAPLSSDAADGENSEENASHEEIRSKLTLVDLAGSERIKRTGAEGARMKEGININKGLFVLGQVVSALSELGQSSVGSSASAHIPYRDSKLTRLLQDSLGGNSKTVMLACVSPADSNVDESVNTLRYATRARNIKNSAVRNVVAAGMSASEATALRRENQVLKLELAQAQVKMGMMAKEQQAASARAPVFAAAASAGTSRAIVVSNSSEGSSSENSIVNVEKLDIVTQLRARCASLTANVEHMKEEMQSSGEDALTASLKADRWQLKCEQISASAKEKGVIFLDDEVTDDSQGIVSKLRKEAAELKEQMREARADAALARAMAAAVVAGGGNLSAVEEMALLSKDGTQVPFGDGDGSTTESGTEGDGDANDEQGVAHSEELTKELVAMSGTIEEKEAMAAQMNREREAMETLQSHFQGAMQKLQEEVGVLAAEREGLVAQVGQASGSDAASSSGRGGGRRGRGRAKNGAAADDPAKRKLRDRIGALEGRIKDLQRKAAEHAKSIRMKDQAEKKCEKLAAEIVGDKRRRADLQKRLKESSVERRAEKREAQQAATKALRDRQKLQRELSKVRDAAAKQAAVLKRKAAEALRKQKREAELQRKRSNAASMRAAASGPDAVKEGRKGELTAWIDREVDTASALTVIRGKLDEQLALLEEAQLKKEQLLSSKAKELESNDDDSDMRELDSEMKSREEIIKHLEADIEEVRTEALDGKSSSGATSQAAANSVFVDNATWQGLSRPEVRFVASAAFELVVGAQREADDARATEDSRSATAVRKAVSEERRRAETSLAEVKLQHSETVMTLLESTKGAMEHKVRSDLDHLATEDGSGEGGLDASTKSAIDDMLGSFLSGCDKVGNTVKDELQKVHDQQEDMLTLQAQVAKDFDVGVLEGGGGHADGRKKTKAKAKSKRKSISDDERDFIFQEEDEDGNKNYDSDGSEWSPDEPSRRKSRKSTREKKGAKGGICDKVKGDAASAKHPSDSSEDTLQGETIPLNQSNNEAETSAAAAPPKNLDKLKVAELRALLRQRGIKVSGKKADLLRRLRVDPTATTAGAATKQEPQADATAKAEDAKADVKADAEAASSNPAAAAEGATAAEDDKENSMPRKKIAGGDRKQPPAADGNKPRRASRSSSRRAVLATKPGAENVMSSPASSAVAKSSGKSVGFLSSSVRCPPSPAAASATKRPAGPVTQSAKKRRRRSMAKAVTTALDSVENILGNIG